MLGLFFALQVVCCSPTLHRWLHPNSTSPDHQCVIRLVSQGQIDHAHPEVVLPTPPRNLVEVVCPDFFVLLTVDYRLLPGRAPPSVSSSIKVVC
jgi:hypothetical protein